MAEQRSNELDAFQEWYSANPPSTYRDDWQFARACWAAASEQAARAAGEEPLRPLIEKHWPAIREAYLSPLSYGDDNIVAWQVELMLVGGHTRSWSAKTVAEAIRKVDSELKSPPSPVAGGPGAAERSKA